MLGAVDAVTFRESARPRPKFIFSLTEGRPSGFVARFGSRQVPLPPAPDEAPKEKP